MVETKPVPPVALTFVALALAGCLGGDSGADAAPPAAAVEEAGDVDAGSVNETTMSHEPTEMTLYFTADKKLSPEPQEPGAVVQRIWADDYAQGRFAVDDFAWVSEPLAMPAMIVAGKVTMTYWIETDHPIVPFGSGGPFVVSHLGSTKALAIAGGAQVGTGAFMPGTATKFDVVVDFAPPRLPVVVPQGEAFRVFGGLSGLTTDQAPVRILVGGDRASSVTFTHVMLVEDPLANATEPETITAAGTFGPTHDAPPIESKFAVGPDATFLEVQVRPTSTGRPADFDLELVSGTGEVVASSTTPGNIERAYLAGPALEGLRGTEVKVRVTQFLGMNAGFEVTFAQG